jgi:hypothetical protein
MLEAGNARKAMYEAAQERKEGYVPSASEPEADDEGRKSESSWL